jgi:hypothetical protein
VLLDADHSYDGVKDQHVFYAPYATKVLAFHDIAGLRDCEGVAEYWDEVACAGKTLKPGYYEIIADSDQRGGIGYVVLAEAEAAPEPVTEAPKAPAKKPTAPRKPAAKKPTAASKKAPAKK